MGGLVRIDGPVKISPNSKVDLSPYLDNLVIDHRGFEVIFKVATIVTDVDSYDFEQTQVHHVNNVHRRNDSITFAVSDQSHLQSIDFGLDSSNVLFIVAQDATVKEVLLEFIDIAPI